MSNTLFTLIYAGGWMASLMAVVVWARWHTRLPEVDFETLRSCGDTLRANGIDPNEISADSINSDRITAIAITDQDVIDWCNETIAENPGSTEAKRAYEILGQMGSIAE